MGNFITHLTRKKGMNIFIVNIISVYDDVCVGLFHIIIFLSLMRQKDDVLHKKQLHLSLVWFSRVLHRIYPLRATGFLFLISVS